MCGIVGSFRIQPSLSEPFDKSVTSTMLKSLSHRGPDGIGNYFSDDGLCWFGHSRLAIIDLVTGQQPMSNEDNTLWVCYNGEIYNYKELRTKLIAAGHKFRTASDTEVLLHGYKEWGDRLPLKLRGIFAFAVYDTNTKHLFLARDHMGVKPLHWWSNGKTFLFASEMKALLAHPEFTNKTVSKSAVSQILVSRFVSRPNTIFEEIRRLPEATYMRVELQTQEIPMPIEYWDVKFNENKFSGSDDEALINLDSMLKEIVEMQMMSDVPLGAQLSGGVDSSIVVALMDEARKSSGSSESIMTFSVGFDVKGFSELDYAKQIANRYNTKHREIHVSFSDFVSNLAEINWYYDEPNSEPSSIPTYLMCKVAKEDVTVMLTGEGADEHFGGYNKYAFDLYSRYIDWMPNGIRKSLLHSTAAILPFRARRLKSILEILAFSDASRRFATWYGALDPKNQKSLLTKDTRENFAETFFEQTYRTLIDQCDSKHLLDQFLYTDIHTRLADNLLVKGDRTSMGAGVEARVPLLDDKLVTFAASLPTRLKVKGLKTKILLKRLAEKYLPYETIYRRKVGFTVPLSAWFCGPLANLLRKVLLSDRCLARGYFDPDAMHSIVNRHINREVDREQGLWVLLSLELWHRMFIDDDGTLDAASRLQTEIDSLVERN